MIGRARPRLDARVLAFVVTAGLAAAAPSARAVPGIDLVQVRPNPFTPNGDGQQDSTELFFTPTGDSANVGAHIEVFRVAGNVSMGVLLATTSIPAHVEHHILWNPGPIPDGLYRFDIAVTEAAESTFAFAFVEADTTAPVLSIGAITPNPFDPEIVGGLLHVPLTIATNDSTTATTVLVRRNGAMQDSIGTVEGPGTFPLEWDGLSATQAPFPSGVYEVFAESRDGAGNSSSAARAFTIDQDAPGIIVPDPLQTTSFPLAIRGTAFDDDRVVGVSARVVQDSTAFVPADSLSAPADTVQFVVLVQDASPEPGFRDVEILAEDAVGHAITTTVQVAYDTFLPVAASTVPADGIGPYGEGETVRIRTTWNADDLEIEGNFSEMDAKWVSGAESVVNEGGGSYLVSYTLSRTPDRSSGTKFVQVTGRKGFLAGTDSVSVIFGGDTPGSEIAVDRNRIDPSRGEVARIHAPELDDPIEVDIYNLAGARVRSLAGTGQVDWDGRTEDGATAAGGTYFLRCTSGSMEEVRRLVVRSGG